ncbi:hypothetical protein [Luteolibacter sp. Populi]|uniref:hypothetical protein n=1 Tax=Luteolibacter sp. Populi TaxID=3230487 RepID=UPI003465E421
MRDLTAGLRQQMFFWGKDAVHPSGNLFQKHGFDRRPSPGLQGTSCYGLPWQAGHIELHGACAGWYPLDRSPGFVFIRPLGKCFLWQGSTAPVPGEWPPEMRVDSKPEMLREAGLPFFTWWLDWEQRILEGQGKAYRHGCYRHFRKLPKSKPWLPPEAAREWLSRFMDEPAKLARSNRFLSR